MTSPYDPFEPKILELLGHLSLCLDRIKQKAGEDSQIYRFCKKIQTTIASAEEFRKEYDDLEKRCHEIELNIDNPQSREQLKQVVERRRNEINLTMRSMIDQVAGFQSTLQEMVDAF